MLAGRAPGPRSTRGLKTLLRIAERDSRPRLLALRFADLVRTRLFKHRSVADLDRPPPTSQPLSVVQNQLTFAYA